MKMMKRNTFASIFTALVILGLLIACDNGTTPSGEDPGTKTGAVTGVTLDSPSISIPVNGTATLTATVVPDTATNKNVTWSSSDTSKATVANGVVTAKTVGTAIITVKTEDGGKTATCNVTITPLPASIAVTNPPTKTIYAVGETLDLTGLVVTVSYDGDYPDEVVTVNISNISGFDPDTPGEQELTITYGGQIAKFTVKVIVLVTDITGVPSFAIVDIPLELSVTVTPETASPVNITWTVKSGAAEITGSTLTASAAGTVVITAACINSRDDDFSKDFTITVYPAGTVIVTSNADTGEGSLRQALTSVPTTGRTIVIDPIVKTIALSSRLPTMNRNITIEGNGVTLTPAAGWTESASSQMMYFTSGGTVTIKRVWFKDGRATSYGAAIYALSGNLTLESCIFSGNRNSGTSAYGGAIDNYGTLSVKGCTFYGNSGMIGGAIYNGGTLTLTGNLFYGNTATNYGPVVYKGSTATVTSNGYNAVDVTMGTTNTQSGWEADTTDTQISSQPISPVTFKVLAGSDAAGVISALPAEYPSFDFYGEAITVPAAAGAVQDTASAGGYALNLSVNDSARGSINVTPDPNIDGLYSGTVTITANPANDSNFAYWLKDGTNAGSTNPLALTITAHTSVQAVFTKVFIVNNFSDESGSATTVGTLRHAITNAQNDDIIRLSGVTPGTTSIALASRLPYITKSIIIEGNGVTLTPGSGWTVNSLSNLVNISSGTVTISRVWFKDGRASAGGAISNSGNLTLESCIFSGNQATEYFGGAIANGSSGTLNVKGCTFYENSAASYGGAIYTFSSSSPITLTGNLFYGNTAPSSPVVYAGLGGNAVTSLGYNVVDAVSGTGTAQCGWTYVTGDKQISSQPVSAVSFRLLSGSGAANVMSALPSGYPAFDFYGDAVTAPAAAGAVQSGGYTLNLAVNNNTRGSVSAASPPADNLYSTVTITAVPENGYELSRWQIDGVDSGNTNPLTITLTANTVVMAVFGRLVTVNNFSDASGSGTTAGTLRYALTDPEYFDIIRLSGVRPGETVIELTSQLYIGMSITIEGNGVTLTQGSGWTGSSAMMYVGTVSVTISRVWFKDGRGTINFSYGAAIESNGNQLTLESCIFSGNQTSGSYASGGAIYNGGKLNVKGCTFYGNSSKAGGAIYFYANSSSGTLTLAGNLFYENTASEEYPVVRAPINYPVNSIGYNVVDVAFGTGTDQCGWANTTGNDTYRVTTSSPFTSTVTLAPVSTLATIPQTFAANMPTTYFNGETRTYPGVPGAVK
jgi:uncharacterized protein YjdB